VDVLVSDPMASEEETFKEYGISLIKDDEAKDLSAVILATPHKQYLNMTPKEVCEMHKKGSDPILMDVKRVLNKEAFEKAGVLYSGL